MPNKRLHINTFTLWLSEDVLPYPVKGNESGIYWIPRLLNSEHAADIWRLLWEVGKPNEQTK